MTTTYSKTVKARELPPNGGKRGHFAPDEQVTITIAREKSESGASPKRFIGAGKACSPRHGNRRLPAAPARRMAILEDLPGGRICFIYAVEAVTEYSAAVDGLFEAGRHVTFRTGRATTADTSSSWFVRHSSSDQDAAAAASASG